VLSISGLGCVSLGPVSFFKSEEVVLFCFVCSWFIVFVLVCLKKTKKLFDFSLFV